MGRGTGRITWSTLGRGLHSGWQTGWTLSKVIFPVTLVVALIKETPVMDGIVFLFTPVMQWLGLPGEAAVPLAMGLLVNVYAAIGALFSLDMTVKDVFILAMMLSFAHNLLVETAVSKRLGVSIWLTVGLRIGLAVLSGYLVNLIWTGGGGGVGTPSGAPDAVVALSSWSEVAAHGFQTAAIGVVQLLAIVVPLMIAIQFLKELRFLERIARRMKPVTQLLGLSENSAISLMAGIFFGLAFGAGVIMENAREDRLSKRDLYLLTIFLVSCHAVVEDTLIFIPLGIPVVPLLLIRLGLAFVLTIAIARVWERLLGSRGTGPGAGMARA